MVNKPLLYGSLDSTWLGSFSHRGVLGEWEGVRDHVGLGYFQVPPFRSSTSVFLKARVGSPTRHCEVRVSVCEPSTL